MIHLSISHTNSLSWDRLDWILLTSVSLVLRSIPANISFFFFFF